VRKHLSFTEPGITRIHSASIRAGVQGYVTAWQGTDEANTGEEAGTWRTSSLALYDG